MRMAFLQASPTRTTSPIWVKMLLSPPLNHTPMIAKSRQRGTMRMIAKGRRKLSYWAASTKNTSRRQSG